MAKYIRFYDNEEANWNNDMIKYESEIDWFHVNETKSNVFVSKTTGTNSKQNQEYIDHFANSGNTYAIFLNKIDAKDKAKILAKAHPNNGIDDNLDELRHWIETRGHRQKILLLDWDRTVTVVEGMQFKGLNSDVKLQHIIEFIMGGFERYRRIEQLFNECMRHNVKIYIITHNPNASRRNENRQIYLEIISEMTNRRIDPNSILFSSSDCGYKKCNAVSAVLPDLITTTLSVKMPSMMPSPSVSRAPSRATSPSVSKAASPGKDYSKMKKDQLIEECKSRGIPCNTRSLKDDLIISLTSSKKGGKRRTRKNFKR
jgi:hypothetical protein